MILKRERDGVGGEERPHYILVVNCVCKEVAWQCVHLLAPFTLHIHTEFEPMWAAPLGTGVSLRTSCASPQVGSENEMVPQIGRESRFPTF